MSTSLEDLCSTEQQRQIAKQLSECGVITDGDLLLADPTVLSKTSSLLQSDIEGFCSQVLYSSIHPLRADKLLSSADAPERISTGYEQLDEILRGGLLPGSITEFAGPSNTGKTLLLSNIVLSHLRSSPSAEAVYIDTLGTYSPSLLQSLLPPSDTDTNGNVSNHGMTILDRIHLMKAFDMVSLIETCEKIKESLEGGKEISMVIMDTIANPISLLMNKGQLQGHALMQSFIHLLRLLTQQYSLCTLLINTAVKTETIVGQSAFMDTRVKPSLGVTWTFCADTCVLMHRSLGEERIIVEVVRSRNGEGGWSWIGGRGFRFGQMGEGGEGGVEEGVEEGVQEEGDEEEG